MGILQGCVCGSMQVSTFYEEVERDRFACKPDILLAYEVYGERRAILLYPINLLRNLARLLVGLASTPFSPFRCSSIHA